MTYKRILTIQDLSCVGQCSAAVALPVLSACGHEACLLPTAILSTHTGGFGAPAVTHLEETIPAIRRHWREQGITFDAVLVGYLGSVRAIREVEEALDGLLSPGGVFILDPVMGDKGRLYSGFDHGYVQEMAELCRRADILLPNLTEAALLSGHSPEKIMENSYVNAVLRDLSHPCVLITGYGRGSEETGFLLREDGNSRFYTRPNLPGSYHGTGDLFAAAFTGALMQGWDRFDAGKIAADFVALAISHTLESPAHWYGTKFETALPELTRWVREGK